MIAIALTDSQWAAIACLQLLCPSTTVKYALRFARLKAGDTVKLVGIPRNLQDDEDLQTRTLFEKCLGQSVVIVAVESFEGVPYPLAKLDVGHVVRERTLEAHHLGRAGISGAGKLLTLGFDSVVSVVALLQVVALQPFYNAVYDP